MTESEKQYTLQEALLKWEELTLAVNEFDQSLKEPEKKSYPPAMKLEDYPKVKDEIDHYRDEYMQLCNRSSLAHKEIYDLLYKFVRPHIPAYGIDFEISVGDKVFIVKKYCNNDTDYLVIKCNNLSQEIVTHGR